MLFLCSYHYVFQGQHNDDMRSLGHLFISASYIERSTATDLQSDRGNGNYVDEDIGFWVALGPKGAWDGFRSLLTQSVITRQLKDDFLALEVFMKNGKRHAVFRGLAKVSNDSDIKVDIATCHMSMIHGQNLASRTSSAIDTNYFNSTICPDSFTVLPWRSMFKDSNQCLQIRPSIDLTQTLYAWGRPVAVEKDQQSIDQGAQSRQNTLKQGNRTCVSPLMLNRLEKKDLLWCCPSSGGKLFWFSICTDASVFHTELNSPVYDWKVSVSSPLKLENRLPCPLEFKIWERLRDGKNVERQKGFISSRGTVHMYSADIRNPIYIMLFVEDGWVIEKVKS